MPKNLHAIENMIIVGHIYLSIISITLYIDKFSLCFQFEECYRLNLPPTKMRFTLIFITVQNVPLYS